MKPEIIRLDKDKGTHQGKVWLALFGFNRQSLIDTGDVINAVKSVPDAHLEGLNEIRYDPGREMQSLLSALLKRPQINRSKAEFNRRLRAINIYEITSRADFYHMLYHELGHHVYFRVMGSELRKRWVRQLYPNSRFVTPYASRNAAEDFAESYAVYKLEAEKLMGIPEKYRFIRDLVFNGYGPVKLDLRF